MALFWLYCAVALYRDILEVAIFAAEALEYTLVFIFNPCVMKLHVKQNHVELEMSVIVEFCYNIIPHFIRLF